MNLFFKLSLLFFFVSLQLQSQKKVSTKLLNQELTRVSKNFQDEFYFENSVSYFIKKQWDSSLVYSQKQLTTSKNTVLIEYSHFIRGYIFNKKNIFKEAEYEYNLISKDNELYNLVKIFLGLLALENNQFKKAITHFNQVINLPEKEFQFIEKNSVIHNLGLCYLHLRVFDKAQHYLSKSTLFYEKQKDTFEVIGCYGDLATLYYEQYKDNLAIPYFEKAYKLAKKTKDLSLKSRTAKNMAVVEENRKNYQRALVYRKEFEKWKDLLNDQNRIYEVAQKEKEFAVKEKQKEVTFLEAENKIKEAQKKELLYAAIVLLTLLLTSIYFYREKVKRNKIIAHQKEDLDALNATKDKLFSIVSHDLRSSVNALKSSNVVLLDNLASKNIDALGNLLKKNSAIVNGAYGLLDNLLHWALSQTKQVYFEIKSTRLFFMVEQMAYNYKPLMLEKNIQFENKVSKKDLVLADQESLKLIIRNLLDNAIKFSNKDGEIKVYSRNEHKGYCDLIVEDTGMGMTNETRLKLLEDTLLLSKKEHEDVIGTGLGLQLCKTMVKKNNGKFSIESELGVGTKMIVSLPKKQDNG
ncbi:tetratricopeptide repeat-containing sensor histidine kinase [Tenacibaculum halocynthiae]|uniref:tetratricopeptide repeat-containing sensor histidine kinase n=1 Tax=Tenacibaculum halocynthiae TaxID=1254437 RepID=UPI003D65DEBC